MARGGIRVDTRALRVPALMLAAMAMLLPLSGVAAPPVPANPSTYTWSIPTLFSVAPNGSPVYRIPIQVPPAPVAPQLELVYTGRGNGFVGLGWSLRGLSVITRCPRTTVQDGARGAVRFNNNDRFCLDGQRLMLVSGTYGGDGSEYRTEQDTFTKIVSHGADARGPLSFTAWTKSGLVMQFGTASSGDGVVPMQGSIGPWTAGTIREWAVNSVTDPRGRSMQVTYQSDDAGTCGGSGPGPGTGLTTCGAYHPVSITYGGNTTTGAANDLSVQFNYQTVPNPLGRFLGGAGLKPLAQLTSVQTMSGGGAVALLTLTYASIGPAQMSRLSSMLACPGTGSPPCQPPVNFSYASATGGFASGAAWSLPAGAVSPVSSVPTQQQVFTYSDTTQYGTTSAPASRTQTQISLVDLNGDGLPDLYVTGYTPPSGGNPEVVSPGQIYLNTGKGFASTPTSWALPSGVKAQKDLVNGNTVSALIDMNGDGLPDLYQTNANGAVVYLNTGSGFSSTATPWPLPSGVTNQRVVTTSNPNSVETIADTQFSVMDIDGDGLPDAIVSTPANPGVVYLGTPTGFGASTGTTWQLPNGTTTNRNVSFSDNFEFGTSTTPLSRTQTQIALVDLNGDGLPDLYITQYDPPGVSGGRERIYPALTYLNTGNGFITSTNTWTLPNGIKAQKDVVNGYTVVMLVDVNGDGLPDLYHTVGPLNSSNPRGEVFLNTGTGFSSTSIPWTLPVQAPTQNVLAASGATQASLIDLDGDGLPDSFVTDGVNSAQAFLGTAAPLARLSQVTAATQPTLNLSWSKLTDPTVYTVDSSSNAATYPWVDIQAGKAVISSTSTDNGIGGISAVQYTYGGLKTELGLGRGLLGFRWMDAKDLTTGVETYSEFRQDFPFTGLVLKNETRLAGSGNGGVLKRTSNTFACQLTQTLVPCSVAPGNIYFPYVSSAVDESWDLNGFTFPTLTTATTYGQNPQYGAPTQVTVTNSDGSSKSTAYQYATPDTSNWILNRLTRATVTSTKP